MIHEPDTIEVTSGEVVAWKTGNHVIIQAPEGNWDEQVDDVLNTLGLLEAETSDHKYTDYGVSQRWEITYV